MKLQVKAEGVESDPGEIEISDVQTGRGTLVLNVDEWPGVPECSAAVEIDREAATKICEHLIAVFGLLSLQPYAGETKPQTKYGVPR